MAEYQQQRCLNGVPQPSTSIEHSDAVTGSINLADGEVREGDFLPSNFDFDFSDALDMPLLNADWDTVLEDWDMWIKERDIVGITVRSD